MRLQFLLFLLFMIVVYGTTHYYVFRRAQAVFVLRERKRVRRGVIVIVALFVAAFPLARLFGRLGFLEAAVPLGWISGLWLALFLPLFLGTLVTDAGRLLLRLFRVRPAPRAGRIAAWSILALALLMTGAGFLNARRLVVERYRIPLPAGASAVGVQGLRVVFVSDTHYGEIIGIKRARQLVGLVNSLYPDLVLFGGDVVDADPRLVMDLGIPEVLAGIRSRLGVYGVSGNHELIGGFEDSAELYRRSGIRLLDDEVLPVGGLLLAGRRDYATDRMAGLVRKPLAALLAGQDPKLPLLVLDHQPAALGESATNAAWLHLSGHTHHGQLFPFHLITRAIYGISRGYERRGDLHVVVSSGAGTWGPPVRTTAAPELVLLEMVPAE